MPKLYIIAGCNGAGKTTASYTVLPEMLDCREFVNADEIAKGLSPFNPESVAIDAGRLMLQRMDDLLIAGEDFAFETTLATRSYVKFIDQAHAMGYFVSLLFFWLPTPELAIVRVATRVSKGGHDIPEEAAMPPACATWSHSTLRCATTGSSTTTAPPMPKSGSSRRERTIQQSTSKIR